MVTNNSILKRGLLVLVILPLVWSAFIAQAQGCDPNRPAATVEEWTDKGRDCVDVRNYEQGIADLTRAIEMDPNYARAYNNRAVAYRNTDRTGAALDDLNKALSLDPNYAIAYYNRGLTHYDLGNLDRTLDDTQRALDLRYEQPELVYQLQGWTQFHLGNYRQAIAEFNNALAANPNFDRAYWGLGDTYRQMGDFEQAVAYYHQHIDLAGENARPEIVAYVAGYEGDYHTIGGPQPSGGGGRSNMEYLLLFAVAIAGIYIRFRWLNNRWQAHQTSREQAKYRKARQEIDSLGHSAPSSRPTPSEPPVSSSRSKVDTPNIPVNQQHPANLGVMQTLAAHGAPNVPVSRAPASWGIDGLGMTHPDVLDYFWLTMHGTLPEYCRMIVHGRPALVHPKTGVIFGFCIGTSPIALRLPKQDYAEAVAASKSSLKWTWNNGKSIEAERVGPDWVFVGFKGQQWCLRAYEYAGTL